jgi:deoxyribonuclease-4
MLGVHVTKDSHVLDDKTTAPDLSDAIIRDTDALKLNCAQVFTYGPRFLVKNKIDYDAVKKATQDIDVSVHSAYQTTGIWKINGNKAPADVKKIDTLKLQLLSCNKINAWGLVLHINKIYPDVAADVMAIIKPIVKKSKVKLLLEMVSSKADADKTYETPEKIDNLTTLIGPKEDWWGWCVDTAHLWGAGVNIKSYESMKDWLSRLTYKNKILMFHLNGSSAIRGSGKDKHEVVFGPDDLIWHGVKPAASGVRAIIEFAEPRNIPIICEITRGAESVVRKGIEIIKDLFKSE